MAETKNAPQAQTPPKAQTVRAGDDDRSAVRAELNEAAKRVDEQARAVVGSRLTAAGVQAQLARGRTVIHVDPNNRSPFGVAIRPGDPVPSDVFLAGTNSGALATAEDDLNRQQQALDAQKKQLADAKARAEEQQKAAEADAAAKAEASKK